MNSFRNAVKYAVGVTTKINISDTQKGKTGTPESTKRVRYGIVSHALSKAVR